MLTLYAAGLNGHGQLRAASKTAASEDISQFEPIAKGNSIEVLLAKWSRTALRVDRSLLLIGFYNGLVAQRKTLPLEMPVQSTFECGTAADIGFVDTEGRLYLLQHTSDTNADGDPSILVHQGSEDSPKMSFVAITTTGHTCVSFLQSPASQLIHLLQFKSFSTFLTWFSDPSASSRGEDYMHYSVRGRVAQLEAGAGHFILRTESGDVYSWTTDARHYRCLGRSVSAETPASLPAMVAALGGIPIAKVAVGDWITIGLSHDRDGYIWGKERPQVDQRTIAALPAPDEEVKLIEVDGGADVADVAVGSGHLLALTASGMLFAAGEAQNGQLSLEDNKSREEHIHDWKEVTSLNGEIVKRIWAGNCTSFALLEDKP